MTPDAPRPFNRRKFVKRLVGLTGAGVVGSFAYSWFEASWMQVTRSAIPVAHLPTPFEGKTIAVLADIHYGRFNSIVFVRKIVDATNELQPDLIALVGDYVHHSEGRDLFAACFAELKRLTAPLGVYCVPGNHDYWDNIDYYHAAIASSNITELTNRGVWISLGGARLRIGGVDDLWCGHPNLDAALDDCKRDDAAVLLCHNPDYVEDLADPRVGLVLSGHTHGGQILLPFVRPQVPSRFGAKYLKGLIQGPVAQVYVSRGLGVVTVPFRFRSRPEIALLTLATA